MSRMFAGFIGTAHSCPAVTSTSCGASQPAAVGGFTAVPPGVLPSTGPAGFYADILDGQS